MSQAARRLIIATSVLLLAAPVVAQPGSSAAAALAVGQPFPTLTLPALEDGRPRSLAEFRGRKVILHVFASW